MSEKDYSPLGFEERVTPWGRFAGVSIRGFSKPANMVWFRLDSAGLHSCGGIGGGVSVAFDDPDRPGGVIDLGQLRAAMREIEAVIRRRDGGAGS